MSRKDLHAFLQASEIEIQPVHQEKESSLQKAESAQEKQTISAPVHPELSAALTGSACALDAAADAKTDLHRDPDPETDPEVVLVPSDSSAAKKQHLHPFCGSADDLQNFALGQDGAQSKDGRQSTQTDSHAPGRGHEEATESVHANQNISPLSATPKEHQSIQDNPVDLDYAIAVVMETGVLFLESGAEVYRAEDTINRLGKAIPGVEDCISYVTVTGIMCSMVAHGRTVTRIARVGSSNRNISVINAINQLSRNASAYHFNALQIARILEKIRRLPRYSTWQTILFGAIGAAGFAVFFNGRPSDVISVFVIGLCMGVLNVLLGRLQLHQIFVNGLAAFTAAALSRLAHVWLPLTNVDQMTLSCLMLLVPGLILTNAIRDTVMGEYLSGVARGAEALIIATSIAIGAAIGLYMGT